MSAYVAACVCVCVCVCASVSANVTCVRVHPCLCGHNWDVVCQGNTNSIFFSPSQPVRDRNGCFCLMKASKQRSSVCFDKGNVHASE